MNKYITLIFAAIFVAQICELSSVQYIPAAGSSASQWEYYNRINAQNAQQEQLNIQRQQLELQRQQMQNQESMNHYLRYGY